MKVSHLLEGGWKVAESEDGDSLLKMLIQQRLDKLDPVKLDFLWDHGSYNERYQGYVQLIRGNTLHTMFVKRGDKETERFVLPPNVDEFLTLRKLNGMWVVQGI